MNFFGMGAMEVLIILLVAFIFLGPNRMVDAARFLGKMVGEARRMTAELSNVVLEDEVSESGDTSMVRRGGAPSPAGLAETSPDHAQPTSETGSVDGDGPGAFHSVGGDQSQRDPEPPQGQDQACQTRK